MQKMKYHAYWISKDKTIPVPTTHIETVIRHPEKFGYTRERIEQIYCKHNEPVGFEGFARQEIMRDIISNQGWIRARYTPRFDKWTFELAQVSEATRSLVNCFVKNITATYNHNSEIRLLELSKQSC